jgi:hypothetical protein
MLCSCAGLAWTGQQCPSTRFCVVHEMKAGVGIAGMMRGSGQLPSSHITISLDATSSRRRSDSGKGPNWSLVWCYTWRGGRAVAGVDIPDDGREEDEMYCARGVNTPADTIPSHLASSEQQ